MTDDADARRRRRRRDQVFGEGLPETTADERQEPGERGQSDNDEWLRSNVPPHHG